MWSKKTIRSTKIPNWMTRLRISAARGHEKRCPLPVGYWDMLKAGTED
jgi:hypothetical protein